MFTWFDAAIVCKETYDVETDMKEGYFVCPHCNETIYECDWGDQDDWSVCPICYTVFEGFEE